MSGMRDPNVIRKFLILLLALLAGFVVVLIPVSYLKAGEFEAFNLCIDDRALMTVSIEVEVERMANNAKGLGRWTYLGEPNAVRALMGAVSGNLTLAIAIPRSKPGPQGRQLATAGPFLGVRFLYSYQPATASFWSITPDVDVYGASAPLLGLFLIFGAFPVYAFVMGPLQRFRHGRRGLCVQCGYDLAGNTSGVCPECGTAIEKKG